MDFGLPGENGVEATQKIIEERPDTVVVFLTVFDTDEFLFSAIRSGAKGYLLKSLSSVEFLASLRAIDRSEAAISSSMTRRILDEFSRLSTRREPGQSKLADLTFRELEILKEVAIGKTNHEISLRFLLSEATVKNHIHNILSKLGLKNRSEAAWFAHRHGIVDPAKPDTPHNL
jgi:DNA-binding NarL/FixJ family response regulator